MIRLTDSVTELRGVGPKKAEALREAGIETAEDLIWCFPLRYEDRRTEVPISKLTPGETALVRGKVLMRRYSGYRYRNRSPLSLTIGDDSGGTANVVFFNGSYLSRAFEVGSEYLFYGKPSVNKGALQLVHPEFARAENEAGFTGIIPVYPNIPGLSQNDIRKLMDQVYELSGDVKEWLPEHLVRKYNLAGPSFALENVHRPKDALRLRQSRYRLIFEELVTLETGLLYSRQGSDRAEGIAIDPSPAKDFIESLPFELTEGQRDAWSDIAADLSSAKAMNRLIQGDVGSGKTAVAEIAMYCSARAGFQSVMMAPTEILAKQHHSSLSRDFAPFGITVGLLCSSMKAAEKKKVLAGIASGEIQILVGTHAVIQHGVEFSDLGLVITDEQHRFGVRQRKLLSEKREVREANVMVMTATPIPRTLAVIIYGDLDISAIRTMPKGRRPVITYAATKRKRRGAYDFVRERLAEGRQAYVVAPLIEGSDKIDARSAEELYRELTDLFREYKVAMIHGGLKQEEKDAVMEDFAAGKTDVLVSTVVIEVGINIPNATVMVIENCERFGLSQMHQLRGRVGRGSEQSYCILLIGSESEIALKRAEIMKSTTDGFLISEKDLEIRGPGEIFGTRQHGIPELHISDIMKHGDVLEKAKDAARDVLREDPFLTSAGYAELRRRTEKLFKGKIRLEL